MNFTQQVWQKIKQIPRGKVTNYSKIARSLGKPKAVRAVGTACAKNRDPKIPCHRVIRKDGSVGNYNQGQNKKIKLLKKEGVKIIKNKIPPSFYCRF